MKKFLLFVSFVVIILHPAQSITAKLNEINFQGSSMPYFTVKYKGQLIFTPENADTGRELWGYDLGSGKSKLIKDIFPNSNSGIDSDPFFNVLNDKLYFVGRTSFSNYRLFSTNGTEAGTEMVFTFPAELSYIDKVVMAGDKIFILANYQLWVSDGTSTGTKLLKTFGTYTSGSVDLRIFGNKIVTAIDDGINGKHAWISDGTTAGTFLLKKISATGSSIGNDFDIVVYNNKFYFYAYDTESALWESDGTVNGTKKFTNKVNGSFIQGFALGDNFVFGGRDSANGMEPWISDGTVDGTKLVKDVVPGVWGSIGINSKVVRYKNKIAFDIINNSGDFQIWETDGTFAGTKQIAITDATLTSPKLYKASTDRTELLITTANAGNNFWIYDDENGLSKIPNLIPTIYTEAANNFIDIDNFVYLTAIGQANGAEIFKINKQSREVSLVTDVNSSQSASPQGFIKNTNGLIVAADDGVFGNQFYKINPDTSEKTLIKILSNPLSGERATLSNKGLIKLGNDIYQKGTLGASTPNGNYSLFAKTDGTAENTNFVKYPNNTFNSIGDIFENLNDEYLVFSANEPLKGTELYRIKKGSAEIELLKDISTNEGGGLYNVDSKTVIINGFLYFIARENNLRTIWKTDGTPENTQSAISFIDNNFDGNPKILGSYDGKILISKSVYYQGIEYQSELYISDGTQSNTTLLKSQSSQYFNPESINDIGTQFKEEFYYTTKSGVFKTDGTAENTKTVYSANGISDFYRGYNRMTVCGDNLFIGFGSRESSYYDGSYDKIYELWRTDGNTKTNQVYKVQNQSGMDDYIKDFKCINNYVYFTKTNDSKIWRTNGNTTENVALSIDVIDEEPFNSDKNEFIGDLFLSDNKLLFTANTRKYGVEYYEVTSELPVYLNVIDANTNSVQKLKLLIYPNPASDLVKIKDASAIKAESFAIYDYSGKVVSEGKYTGEDQSINISMLNKGVYVIQVKTKTGQSYAQKLIKN